MPNVAEFVASYARPPAQTTVDRAVSIHTNIRALLGDAEYDTFLQGSYKNDTALWDLNDVDVVAVSRALVSTQFGGSTGGVGVPWTEIFARIERKLQGDVRYQGKWERGDKCIRVNTGVKVDIVPGVRVGDVDTDPVAIFSFKAASERKNWPRLHYDAGVAKSGATNGAYKQTVRLFKRWAKCWFGDRKVAPSYYIECCVHSAPDSTFTGRAPQDFFAVATHLAGLDYHATAVPRLTGTDDILTAQEWELSKFNEFQTTLRHALVFALAALGDSIEVRAKQRWIAAFNGRAPT